MSRRHFLAIVMAMIILAGLLIIILMFAKSLSPTGNAKVITAYRESGILEFPELKIGSEIEKTFRGSPIIIKRLSENEYQILSLIPKFSKNNVYGCYIKRLFENSLYREDYPSDTYFIEPCRGVNYDEKGNVIKWSHPSALPMQRFQWKYVTNNPNRIEIYP